MEETTLRTPFPFLSEFISRGSAGQVFAISTNLVLKCPTLFTNPAPAQSLESKESIEKIEREKSVYEVLMRCQHRNIVSAVLCVPEGIFMQRLACDLRSRIENHAKRPIKLEKQCLWIKQLASAVEWLERLGYAHGDLRPANILLDAEDTIKVADFDSTVRYGEQLLVTTLPFCKLDDNYEAPLAGALTEQYAVGSCIYNIRNLVEPFHDLPGPVMVRKLINNEFPVTSHDHLFGDIILGCWHGKYSSIQRLQRIILAQLRSSPGALNDKHEDDMIRDFSNILDCTDKSLVFECEAFLKENRKRAGT
ncbi:hypothetical protein MMC19_006430 [Ptychographa xylographoides]|nr:hypothetical protein [Ptychographa xylographoides]